MHINREYLLDIFVTFLHFHWFYIKNMTLEVKSMEKYQKSDNKGYSLVELVIAIAIIAILAASVSVAVLRYMEKGRQAVDVANASVIKDALNTYAFPSDYQGEKVTFTDSVTHKSETYTRGWVYVDKDEVRCSDASTALAMIQAGLVYVSYETEVALKENEENPTRWFPSGQDHDYYRRSGIDEYVFKNNLRVKALTTWNTYQLDVYVDSGGELHLGATASNTRRTDHTKDEDTAKLFAQKLGFYNAKVTPVGQQYSGN